MTPRLPVFAAALLIAAATPSLAPAQDFTPAQRGSIETMLKSTKAR
jgi:hypothetical protein